MSKPVGASYKTLLIKVQLQRLGERVKLYVIVGTRLQIGCYTNRLP